MTPVREPHPAWEKPFGAEGRRETGETKHRLKDVARLCGMTADRVQEMLSCGRLGGFVGLDNHGFFCTEENVRRLQEEMQGAKNKE
ncbi:MAG: hypothetical protein PHW10_00040 [Candidatus Peribacteraceae bacterium]|nr:hypothetical protein [Candidatus Peribacteraceae bacterium]